MKTDAQKLIKRQKAREKRLKNIPGATKKQSDSVQIDMMIAKEDNLSTDMETIYRFKLKI